MLKYALITMYSNVHIPAISDYIATSLTDASTSYITLNTDPLSIFITTAIRARSQTNRTPKHKKQNIKYQCGICPESVKKNQYACFCVSCHQWIHFIKCNKSTKSEYAALIDESEDIPPWYCVKCTISKIADMFPFLSLDNNERNDLHHIDKISHLDLLPSYELQSKLSRMPNLSDAEIENNYVYRINSDYYNLEEFKSLN